MPRASAVSASDQPSATTRSGLAGTSTSPNMVETVAPASAGASALSLLQPASPATASEAAKAVTAIFIRETLIRMVTSTPPTLSEN
ncbi:hypothetical protein [Rhodococcus qingshengii]|uniref:hypothetical protein n=1 Tax=Rhodococcus qingshengii TaxID=334542 RepID=UPI001F5BAB1C|nr:hypothetical protein [Rhodococcus qingshengii]